MVISVVVLGGCWWVLASLVIMAAELPLAVLLLGHLGFSTWEYGIVFAVPCIGGLVGSRVVPAVVARFGEVSVLRVLGTLRAFWPVGLALVVPGLAGITIVMVIELGLIVCCAVFNPVLAAHRLQQIDPTRQARVLTAWSIGTTALQRSPFASAWSLR